MSVHVEGWPPELIPEFLCDDAGYFLKAGRLLERGHSEWQSYEVWDTPRFGRLFRLDGCFMTSERDEFYYHENLIHVPGLAHAGLRRAKARSYQPAPRPRRLPCGSTAKAGAMTRSAFSNASGGRTAPVGSSGL